MGAKVTKRRLWFHTWCLGAIVFIQVIAMGLILTGNKSLFMQITAGGPAYLLPLLVVLSAFCTVILYIVICCLVSRSRTRNANS